MRGWDAPCWYQLLNKHPVVPKDELDDGEEENHED